MEANGFQQTELNFSSSSTAGYASWLQARDEAIKTLRHRCGLPIGREVEVWLRGNIRLKGRLRLKEESLFVPEQKERDLRLCVGQTDFAIGEIESCLTVE